MNVKSAAAGMLSSDSAEARVMWPGLDDRLAFSSSNMQPSSARMSWCIGGRCVREVRPPGCLLARNHHVRAAAPSSIGVVTSRHALRIGKRRCAPSRSDRSPSCQGRRVPTPRTTKVLTVWCCAATSSRNTSADRSALGRASARLGCRVACTSCFPASRTRLRLREILVSRFVDLDASRPCGVAVPGHQHVTDPTAPTTRFGLSHAFQGRADV